MPPPIYTPPLTLEQLNQRIQYLGQQLSCCYVRKDEQVSSCCYTEVTYAEAQTLVGNSELSPNKMYKITDRGDRGIFLMAQTTSKFNEQGVRLMLLPNFLNLFTATIDGDWGINGTTGIGNKVFYLGLVYRNLTGNNGGDPVSFPNDWELIPKTNFTDEYVEKAFDIMYDFDNDWISKQWDEHGNIFGIPYTRHLDYPEGNPVDISDWVYADYLISISINLNNWTNYQFHSNHCDGIWSNGWTGSGSDFYKIYGNKLSIGAIYGNNLEEIEIYNNTNNGGIFNNGDFLVEGYIHIANNRNNGSISFNSHGKEIVFNYNNGSIEGNINDGDINYNGNNGGITNNSNGDGTPLSGNISYNINNGSIDSCSSSPNVCNIINNVNNGNISGTFAADVTDPVVNKN